jgi:hypothetical protein
MNHEVYAVAEWLLQAGRGKRIVAGYFQAVLFGKGGECFNVHTANGRICRGFEVHHFNGSVFLQDIFCCFEVAQVDDDGFNIIQREYFE